MRGNTNRGEKKKKKGPVELEFFEWRIELGLVDERRLD